MENDKIITDFPVSIFGTLEKYNEVISKGRCRIFYRGKNRNGTFITDEFADKLLSTISYAPVKGIYDADDQDFTDHGLKRDLGRIYGIVPADPNLSWEKNVDEDGVEREYATVDVLIYTGLYEEANQIVGKSQSMELFANSIKGDWQIIDGRKYFVYTDACFLGLQALGDNVEPCFEGAAFFSIYQSLKDLVDKMEQINFQKGIQGGTNKMPMVNFKMSDNDKFNAIWALLNPNYNEENNWAVDYGICDVYDEYAVVRNYAEGIFERVYYVKNDETDSLEFSKKERCFIIDVNEKEKQALDAIHALNNDTYENLDNNYQDLQNKVLENDTNFTELNTQIATLNTEKDNLNSQVEELTQQMEELNANYTAAVQNLETVTAERDGLSAYKKSVEDDAKKAVINSYSDNLSDEILDTYRAKIDEYTVEDLDMRLTYEQKKAHPEVFSNNTAPAYVPKDEQKSGIELILSKYEKH